MHRPPVDDLRDTPTRDHRPRKHPSRNRTAGILAGSAPAPARVTHRTKPPVPGVPSTGVAAVQSHQAPMMWDPPRDRPHRDAQKHDDPLGRRPEGLWCRRRDGRWPSRIKCRTTPCTPVITPAGAERLNLDSCLYGGLFSQFSAYRNRVSTKVRTCSGHTAEAILSLPPVQRNCWESPNSVGTSHYILAAARHCRHKSPSSIALVMANMLSWSTVWYKAAGRPQTVKRPLLAKI